MEKNYRITHEQYVAVKAAWNSHSYNSAADHIIYNVLRSKPSDFGFTENKRNVQGNDPWYGYNQAYTRAVASILPFRPSMTESHNARLRDQAEQRAKGFKHRWGIDLPEGIDSWIGGRK